MSSLLGPRGLPYVALAGERAYRTRQIGDLVCSFEWLDLRPFGGGTDGPEACMVLFAANRRLEVGSYVIPQRNAWAYADSDGNPTSDFMCTAINSLETLGFDRNDRAAFTRVVDVIVEGLPDLIGMPSEQPRALDVARPVWGIEGTVKMGGRTVHAEVF